MNGYRHGPTTLRAAMFWATMIAATFFAGPAAALCDLTAAVSAVEAASRALVVERTPATEARLNAALGALAGASRDGASAQTRQSAEAYALARRALLNSGRPATAADLGRAAGLARSVTAAAGAAGCETEEPPAEDAFADASNAPGAEDPGQSGDGAGGGGDALATGLPEERASRLATLSSVALTSSEEAGLLRYLPFIALAFCLFFAIRIEDRRRHTRYRCSVDVELPGAGATRMVDISRAGAKIEAEDPPDIGERIEMRVGVAEMRGVVTWANQSFFGLKFARLLPETLVQDLRKGEVEKIAEAPEATALARRKTKPRVRNFGVSQWYKT